MNINKNVAFDFTVDMGTAGVALSVYQSVNGAAYGAAVTDIDTDNSDGTYKLAFSAAFTNYNAFSIKVIGSGLVTKYYDFYAIPPTVNLTQILGTALTETTGLIAAGFKKFFNIATPTGTVNSLPDAVPGASGGLPTTNGTKITQTADLTSGQSIAVSGEVTPTAASKTGYALTGDYDAAKTASSQSSVTSITNILGGITSLGAWLRGLYRKDAMNAVAKSEINFEAGSFDETTDSLQAIRDTAPLGTAMRGTDGAITSLSGVALEATLADVPTNTELASAFTEIKGATWSGTTDTLESIYNNLGGGTGLTAQETRDAAALALSVGVTPATGSIDKHIDDILADTNELQTDWANGGRLDLILDGRAAAYVGSGVISWPYTVTINGNITAGVEVRVYTDSARTLPNPPITSVTDHLGKCYFALNAGTYYLTAIYENVEYYDQEDVA